MDLQQQKLHYLIRPRLFVCNYRKSTIVEITLPYQAGCCLYRRSSQSTIVEITLPYQASVKTPQEAENLQQQKLHYLIRHYINYINYLSSTIVEITLPYQATILQTKTIQYLQQQKLHYLIRPFCTAGEHLCIYNSRNYITLLGLIRYSKRCHIYNSRNYITLLGSFQIIICIVNLQQQKLHYLIRPKLCLARTCFIYNSRNYITLLGVDRQGFMQYIYNSRNYITLLGGKGNFVISLIYNSRNYITLLGISKRGSDFLDLQQQKLHYLIRQNGGAGQRPASTIVEITLPYQAIDESR